MTETEYIIATNRVKVSAAKKLIEDVLPGANYGISDKHHKAIYLHLENAEARLWKSMPELEDA